jgi:hypothetical protein
MDETQVAPPVMTPEPQQPVAAAPPSEQAPPDTQAEQQLATIDPRFFAAYTQGQQKLAAVASALGISRTSTSEQFITAITARRQAAAAEEDELTQDPRIARRLAEMRAHEERMAQQQFGDTAALAATLLEQARSAPSILEFSALVDAALIEKAASRFAGATPAPAGGSPQPQQAPLPQQPPQQGTAPERDLIGGVPPSNLGMFDPEITPDRSRGPQGFFAELGKKLPGLRI